MIWKLDVNYYTIDDEMLGGRWVIIVCAMKIMDIIPVDFNNF